MLPKLLATQALMCLIIVGIAWAVNRRTDQNLITRLGLGTKGALRAVALGCAAWLLSVPVLGLVSYAWQWVLGQWQDSPPSQEWVQQFELARGGPQVLAILFGVLVLPFLEEVLFRGFMQALLSGWLGALPGLTLTALLFAWLHGLAVFLPVFVLALLLGEVRRRTGSLWASFAVHGFHNGLQLALLVS